MAKKADIFYAQLSLDGKADPIVPPVDFARVKPTKQHDWVDVPDTDFSDLVPLRYTRGEGIFLKSLAGVSMAYPKWSVATTKAELVEQMDAFASCYRAGKYAAPQMPEMAQFKWDKRLSALHDQQVELNCTERDTATFFSSPFFSEEIFAKPELHGWSGKWTEKHVLSKPLACLVLREPGNKQTFAALAVGGIFHKKILAKSYGLPYSITDNDGKWQENISDWALNYFKKAYTPKKGNESQIAISPTSYANLQTIVQLLIKYSREMPVLYKYTLRIFDCLPRERQGHITVETVGQIREVIESFSQKSALLGKDAKERKRMFQGIDENLRALSNALDIIERDRIKAARLEAALTKENIFFYAYAVLLSPAYQQRYAEDLMRDYPRLPLYKDFWQWADWGKQLYLMHTDEDALPEEERPFSVVEHLDLVQNEKLADLSNPMALASGQSNKEKKQVKKPLALKASPSANEVVIDAHTCISHLPREVWAWELDGQSAFEVGLKHLKQRYQQPLSESEEIADREALKRKLYVEISRLVRLCAYTWQICKESEQNADRLADF